jgi:hypothetical protein
MSKGAYKPTPAELEGAVDQFLYELHMLRETTKPFIQRSPLVADETMKRVFLESALVHARNLLDFFICESSRNNDILAAHFVTAEDGSTWKPKGLEHLASCRFDINKALTHLTYTRVKSKPSWSLDEIRREIEEAYEEFLSRLPENDRQQWQLQYRNGKAKVKEALPTGE